MFALLVAYLLGWFVIEYKDILHNCITTVLPLFDKREQVMQVIFFINERNVSVMYIDINAISSYLDFNKYLSAG